jgi:hypothetical protein
VYIEDQCIQDFGHLFNTSCADSSWVLWNTTTADYPIDFFCCLPGQIGTQSGYCVAPTALDGATPAIPVCIPLFSSLRDVGSGGKGGHKTNEGKID